MSPRMKPQPCTSTDPHPMTTQTFHPSQKWRDPRRDHLSPGIFPNPQKKNETAKRNGHKMETNRNTEPKPHPKPSNSHRHRQMKQIRREARDTTRQADFKIFVQIFIFCIIMNYFCANLRCHILYNSVSKRPGQTGISLDVASGQKAKFNLGSPNVSSI